MCDDGIVCDYDFIIILFTAGVFLGGGKVIF
jgi:hypothetical protein